MPRLFASCLALLGACAPAELRIPSDFAVRSELLSVHDRGEWTGVLEREAFDVGPYRVHDVQRHCVEAKGYSLFGAGNLRLRSRFGYSQVAAASGALEGQCQLEQQRAEQTLRCRCEGASAATLTAIMKEGKGKGDLRVDGHAYRLTSLHQRVSGRYSRHPLGYRVQDAAGHSAAALDSQLPGRIWLDRQLEPAAHSQLVCLLSGLLLLRPIGLSLPR